MDEHHGLWPGWARPLRVSISLRSSSCEHALTRRPIRGGTRYFEADVADLDRWWDGTAFDGAVCEMAMMDIDDLPATLSAIATTVCPVAGS